MPDFIVTQTAKEYADFKKKQGKKMIRKGLFIFSIFLCGCSVIYYVMYKVINP